MYSFDHDPVALLRAHGDNPFAIPSITHASSADTGSRFCVNSERCSVPAYVRGGKVKTCPLNWFPNVGIASCQIKGLECTTMHIHLYYMGADSTVGRTNYFSHTMLGVVNAMVNMSKCAALIAPENRISASVRDEIMNFQNLSSKVGSKKWSGLTKGVTNVLSSDAMLVLASYFLPMLEIIANGDIGDGAGPFESSFWNGIQPENVAWDCSLSREEMIAFAGKLHKSIVFTTSVAGCKGRFFGDEFQQSLKLDSERIRVHMDNLNVNSSEQVPLSTNYPEDWYDDLNKLLSQARRELHKAAMTKFSKAMKREMDNDSDDDDTPGDESSIAQNFRESPLFVDLGFTVHFSAETETFIFGSLDLNEQIIKLQMRER